MLQCSEVPSSKAILPAVGYEVPDGPKKEPCDSIGHDEDKEGAAPVEVHQGGEDVSQVAVGLLHVAMLNVTATVLLHIALPLTSRPGWDRTAGVGHVKHKRKTSVS